MSSVASNDVRPRLWRSRWAAIGAAVAVTFGGGGLFAVSAASPESSTVAIEPVRILDTRTDVGLTGPFVSPVAQDLKVTGSIPTATGAKTVVPAGATGVFLNLTPVASTAAGFISVRPANAAGLPTTSNVNFTVGAINPNAVLVELPVGGGDDGKIEITFDAFGTAGPTTEVLVDVVGYTTDTRLKAIETSLATKANSADVYTKAEIDAKLAGKLDNAKVLWAIVNSDGTLDQGKGALVAGTASLGVGSYEVAFERDITACAAIAAPADETAENVGAQEATSVQRSGDPTSVFVVTRQSSGTTVNSAFTVVVICP